MAKVAVDAMGGDHAPEVVVEGALLAAQAFGSEIVLVGQQDAIERELSRRGKQVPGFSIVHASQIVTMDESPSNALKKRDSSMQVAFEMMKRGDVQAVVSAGNSGAMMAVGLLVVGPLAEVARPAILIVVPSASKGTVVIDAGANVDCKPRHLLQFGMMGSVYAEQVLNVSKPRVGVLSNGEEESKGNDLTRAASEQLAATGLNYIGYVEGRDIFNGKADVVVCDGFTGNVALKTMEGVASFVTNVLREAFRNNLVSKLGYLLAHNSLRVAYRRLDYAEYGGAPLLGLDGIAIIAHGGSSPQAIKNAIRVANEFASHDVNRRISEALATLTTGTGKEALPRKIWQRLRSKIEGLGDRPPDDREGKDKESGE